MNMLHVGATLAVAQFRNGHSICFRICAGASPAPTSNDNNSPKFSLNFALLIIPNHD